MERVDSIIFDLDGTMWDTREEIAEIWSDAFKGYGLDIVVTKEIISSLMGLRYDEAIKKMTPMVPEEKREEIIRDQVGFEAERILERKGGIVFDDVEDVLIELSKKYKLFIVSNCQVGYIESFLEINNFEKYFIDFENAERTGLDKWENNKLIIERNDLKNPVYIGDTLGDALSAEKAGIPFIYASYGFGDVEKYDRRIDKFKDLIELDILK